MKFKLYTPKNSKIPSAAKRLQGRQNQRTGEDVESIVRHYLERNGFDMVQKIHTAFKPTYKRGKIAGGFYQQQVSGDFRAIHGAGLSCLIEVKHRDKAKFSLSDLEPHQRQALSKHNDLGGLSLVTWVTKSHSVYLMRWPLAIIAKGRPITEIEAAIMSEQTIDQLDTAPGTPWTKDLYQIGGTV